MRRILLIAAFSFTCLSAHAQRFIKVFDNIAAMVSANPFDVHTNVYVVGYRTANDGGQGQFLFMSSETNAANGGIYFTGTHVQASVGKWVRQLKSGEQITPQMFGAVGNGANDDTVALQAALTHIQNSPSVRRLHLSAGTYNITGTLQIAGAKGFVVSGDGGESTVLNVVGTIAGPALKIFNCEEFELSNLALYCNKKSDRGIFFDGVNTPPNSIGRIVNVVVVGAINEGVMVNDDDVNNYQGDHLLFDTCNFYQSKYNYVQNSGNALENKFLNCQFAGFTTNNPDYNIWVKRGGVRVMNVSMYHSTLYDIRLGVGSFFHMDNGYSESERILIADSHSNFQFPTVIRNFLHQRNYNGDVITWERNGMLTLDSCRWGGSIYIGQVLGGTVFNNNFRRDYTFTGSATEIAKLANVQSVYADDVTGANTAPLSLPFRAAAIRFGTNGNALMYETGTDIIVQTSGGKHLAFYDSAAAAFRMKIFNNGEVHAYSNLVSDAILQGVKLTLAGPWQFYTNATQNIEQSAGKARLFFDSVTGISQLLLRTNGNVTVPVQLQITPLTSTIMGTDGGGLVTNIVVGAGLSYVPATRTLSATGNWVGEGTTNSTLAGIAKPWKVQATNSVEVGTAGEAGVISMSSTNGTYTYSMSLLSNGDLSITNNGVLVDKLALVTGYAGGGTKFKSDDGTYKSVIFPPGTTVTNLNINPTDGYYPVRSNSTTFQDGAFYAVNTTNVAIDSKLIFGPGTTNVLYRSGTDLVYTNGGTTVNLHVVNGSGNIAYVETFGGAAYFRSSGTTYLLNNLNNGILLSSGTTAVVPTANNTLDFGQVGNAWKIIVASNIYPVVGGHIIWNNSTNTVFDVSGNGTPEGVITADPGSVYRNFNGGNGTAVYVKESGSGNTGWVGVGTKTNYVTVSLSNPNTVVTTGNTNFWVAPEAVTIKTVTAHLFVPSSSGSVTIELKKNGTTVLSSAATLTSGSTNVTASVSVTSVSALDRLAGEITGAGTTAYGAQLKIGYTTP